MVRPERFELPTLWFVARYSIQLSYGRIFNWRRGRDSNPRWNFVPYSLSRGAPSTTRPPLQSMVREYIRYSYVVNSSWILLLTNRVYHPKYEPGTIKCVFFCLNRTIFVLLIRFSVDAPVQKIIVSEVSKS